MLLDCSDAHVKRMHFPKISHPSLTCNRQAGLSFPWAFGINVKDASVTALVPVADTFDGDGAGISWRGR